MNSTSRVTPMNTDAKPDLVRILAEPDRVVALSAADVPMLLGELERVRAALWDRMLRGSAVRDLAPTGDADDEILTVPEVARELRFTRAYAYEAVCRGDFAAVRTGKYVRIRRADRRAWLEGRPPARLDPRPARADRSRHAPARVGPRSPARAAAGVSAQIHTTPAIRQHHPGRRRMID
jgi:excisionase family DNA binding protein